MGHCVLSRDNVAFFVQFQKERHPADEKTHIIISSLRKPDLSHSVKPRITAYLEEGKNTR
jgi:hypothetical protein